MEDVSSGPSYVDASCGAGPGATRSVAPRMDGLDVVFRDVGKGGGKLANCYSAAKFQVVVTGV